MNEEESFDTRKYLRKFIVGNDGRCKRTKTSIDCVNS